MSVYQINFISEAEKLLPSYLRGPKIVALSKTFFKAIASLFSIFLAFKSEIDFRVSHNNIVIYLTRFLNEKYDNSNKGITITNASIALKYVYTKAEASGSNLEIHVMSENFKPAVFITKDQVEDFVDYTINLPFAVYTANSAKLNEMKAQVDFFNPAGKTYLIIKTGTTPGSTSTNYSLGDGFNI